MRRMINRKAIPMLLLLLAFCSFYICGFAEEELPAYTGKLTQEDTFTEETINRYVNRLMSEDYYAYDASRPEWENLKNYFYVYEVELSSGEPVKNCTFEQLSGPSSLTAFKFEKQTKQINMEMSKISKAVPGVYRFLMTAEGETHYARVPFTIEVKELPKDLAPLKVRPVLILNTLDTVQNPAKSVIISAPEGDGIGTTFEIYDPKSKWYSTSHPVADSSKEGGNFILDWTEEGQMFTPLSEGTYKAHLSVWMGQVLRQEVKVDVIVSSTLSYDDFTLTLSPETLNAAGGQKVKIEAAFADPDKVNTKAKNNGIDWSIATPDGGDASAFASISSGTVTIKKLYAAQDLIVTAQSQMVPEKSAFATIHAVPMTEKLSAEADADTLYLMEGADQAQISVSAGPVDAIPAVAFKSSSDKIATVDDNGCVTAVSAGSATITVTAGDGSKKSSTVKLKVLAPVTGIALSAAQDSVAPGKTLKIKTALEPEKPSDKTLTYTIASADEGLADYLKVSKDGTVTVAKGCPAGSFTVQASANGAAPSSPVTAEITLSVAE